LYSNEDEVIEYATRLSSQTFNNKITLSIVVNQLSSITRIELKEKLDQVSLDINIFYPEKNLGYINGLLYGYQKSIEINQIFDWVIMSNTDIVFLQSDFFENFFSTNYHKDIWLVGPSIYSPNNNSYENPQYNKRHTLKGLRLRKKIFGNSFLLYLYLNLSNFKTRLIKKNKKDSQYTYSLHGCFFFIHRNFVAELLKLKYDAFMYSEEAYLAEMLISSSRKAYYDSKLQVVHKGSSVTKLLGMKTKSNYFSHSIDFIIENFYRSEND
jgi:GT2 family glycosyltransferase